MHSLWFRVHLIVLMCFCAFMPLKSSYAVFPDDVVMTVDDDDIPHSNDVELNDFGGTFVGDAESDSDDTDDADITSLDTALSDDDSESTQLPGVELDDLETLNGAVQSAQVKATVKVAITNKAQGPAPKNRSRSAQSWCCGISLPTAIGVGIYLVFGSLVLAIPTAVMILGDHSHPSLSDRCFPICNSNHNIFYIPKNNTLIPAFCNGTIVHGAPIKIQAADLKALALSRYTAVPSYKGVPVCDVVKDLVSEESNNDTMPTLVPMTTP